MKTSLGAALLLCLAAACSSSTTERPFGHSHAHVTGTVTAGGSPVNGAAVALTVLLAGDCSGVAEAPVVLAPLAPVTSASGAYAVDVAIMGFPTGVHCLVVAFQGTTVKQPDVLFRDATEGAPTQVMVDVHAP